MAQEFNIKIKAFDELSRPLIKIRGVTEKFDRSVDSLSEKFAELKKKSAKLNEFRRLSSETADLREKLNELYKAGGKTKQINKLKIKFDETSAAGAKLGAELKKTGNDVSKLDKTFAKLNAKIDQSKDKMQSVSKAFRKQEFAQQKLDKTLAQGAYTSIISGQISNFGRGGIDMLSGPLRQAISFEEAMADVKKTVDFGSPEELQKFSDLLLNMSQTIPISKEGLAEIAASGGQLGIKTNDLPEFIKTTSKMAIAFGMTSAQAGEVSAKMANVFKIPVGEISNLGDALNHLADNSAAKASDMSDALARIGGVTQTFGLLPTQAAALANSFIALGKSPETASTAINALLLKLQTAPKQGKKFQEALESIGFSSGQMTGMIENDAQGALNAFLERLGGMDKQNRIEVLSEMFGAEFSDDISLLTGSLDTYRKSQRLVADSSDYVGSMNQEAANKADTAGNRIKQLNAKWDALQVKLGESVLPVLEDLVGYLSKALDVFKSVQSSFPRWTKGIMIGIGAISGLAIVFAPIITSIFAAKIALEKFNLVMKKTRSSAAMTSATGGRGGGLLPGKKRKMKSAGKKVGLAGAALGAISIGSTLLDSDTSAQEKVSETASMVGGVAGAAIGGALGSIIPVFGTAIGATLGGMAGSYLAEAGANWLMKDDEKAKKKHQDFKKEEQINRQQILGSNQKIKTGDVNITVNTEGGDADASQIAKLTQKSMEEQMKAYQSEQQFLSFAAP